jgi:excisionase family DNA binding protein
VTAVQDPRYLTVAEVAALLRVCPMTIYRMIGSGDIAAVRIGRLYRVPEVAVLPYLPVQAAP